MATTSSQLPTSIIANGTGVNSWQNPNNILLVDGEFASTSDTSGELTVGTFNLNVPDDSTITNFTIKVKGYRGSFNTTLQIYAVDITSGATLSYPALPFQGFSGSNTEYTLPATLFGTTWNSSQANAIQLKLVADGELHLDSVLLNAAYVANVPVTPPTPSTGDVVVDEFVQGQRFTLAQSMTATDTFCYLQSFTLPNGNDIQIADFHGEALITIDQGVPGKEENVRITNIEHDFGGTGLVKLSFGSLANRGLGFIYPYTSVTQNIVAHVGTAEVVISNSAPFYDRFLRKNQIDALVSAPIYVSDEDVILAEPAHELNFRGAGVSVVNDGSDPNKKIITISGNGTNPATVVSTSSSTSGATQVPTLTWQHTSSGINRLLVVQVSTEQSKTITGITYNGVALTQKTTETLNDIRQEQWFLVAPSVGTYNIVITTSASAYITAGAQTYTGVDQSTPTGASDTATGTSLTPSVSLTTTSDNSIIVDGLATDTLPIVYTVGAGQTSNWSITANPNTYQGASSVESAGSVPDSVVSSYAITQSVDWVITSFEIIGITNVTADLIVKEEGSAVDSNVNTLNFTGSAVTATQTSPGVVEVEVTASGSANEIIESVTQVGHGLSVNQVIKSSGTDGEYDLAIADSASNAEVVGIVTAVAGPDNFTYASQVLGLTGSGIPSITPGQAVWLSATVAGAMTGTKPAAVGQVQKPLGQVTSNATAMNFTADMRGEVITSSTSGATGNMYVGVGEVENTEWFNMQIPFNSPYVWSFTGGGVRSPQQAILTDTAENAKTINSTYSAIFNGNGKHIILSFQALQDSSETAASGAGLNANTSTTIGYGNNTACVAFVTDSSGDWYIKTANGSARTETAISTPATNTMLTWRIELDQANATPQARFYIDGSLVGTITTTLPATDSMVGIQFVNANGTSKIGRVYAPSIAIEL